MNTLVIFLSVYILLLITVGYYLPFLKKKFIARTLAWTIACTTVWFSSFITTDQSALLRMVVIVFLQLLSMKVLVVVETYSGENRLKVFQWLAFALGWFGMRAAPFERLPSITLPHSRLIIKGVIRIAIGLILLYLSVTTEHFAIATTLFIPQLLLLVGISMILHFGILNLSTAAWRAQGVDVQELFRSPYKSASLREFWGKRWNMAFSEMTAQIAYRPLKQTISAEQAMLLSFLLSGLLHEIAISLPVNAGYGLPMLYFALHAAAMLAEAKSTGLQRFLKHPVFSRVWVMGLLIVPLPLLFHQAFILHVLTPLRHLLLPA
ncbi:membrane bound O-acyl transferase family-domain-containing protein [Parachryseolinea silvisoli]|uniref:membrane bound O-acyl transferase family-domain-containing protein n=1 Tax=Parachryseolinea silvisoli TaxID=2873601 RepID=UPI002265C62B|nr:membrane bound O-acyl transferase family-domain-containing protein [Parachryseolinea silvisoli]MCD9017109.1 membrane bound O-acyl transferase family-domain-containing protein [Parachryseolinea silvisoli]